jgi:hypothetical protein
MHADDMVRNMHGFFSSNSTLLKIYKNNKYGEKGGEKIQNSDCVIFHSPAI